MLAAGAAGSQHWFALIGEAAYLIGPRRTHGGDLRWSRPCDLVWLEPTARVNLIAAFLVGGRRA